MSRRVVVIVLALLASVNTYAVSVPCFCGTGAPITHIGPCVTDSVKQNLHDTTVTNFIDHAKRFMEYFQTVNAFYQDVKSLRSTFGSFQGIWNSFDLDSVVNSWQIEDWQEFNDLASNYQKSFSSEELKKEFESNILGNSVTKGQESASWFMSALSYTGSTLETTKEKATGLYEFLVGAKNDVQCANIDNIMNAIMVQESRNATIKAAVGATNDSKESDVSKALGIEVATSPTVENMREKLMTSEVAKTVVWSDMANAIALQTKEKLENTKLMIEIEQAQIEKDRFKDAMK